MKLKYFIVFIAFIFPTIIFSQNNFIITGKVDNKKKQPIPNAKISLLRNDSSIIVTAFSDNLGFYKLLGSKNAKFIKVEMQGYNTEIKNCTDAETIDFTLFEAIYKTLSEVTITAKKTLVEYRVDRIIFNVENSISATGGDAIDAMRRAPGVLVAGNDISVAGKSSVSIMINGRLQQLSGDDLMQMLHSISTDNISKIEIITSPSSKYDAEGNAGIINLILKKNRQKGFKGNVTSTYEYNNPLNFATVSTSLNYKKNNLNLFCNANGGQQGWNYSAYTNTYYPNQFWHQDVKYPYINSYGRFQLGSDYALTKKSTVGFMVNEAFSRLNNNESIIASSYDLNNKLDSTITTKGETTDKYLGKLTTNLNYEYHFDSIGKKMNVDIDYYRQKGNKHRDFTVENEIPLSSFLNQVINRTTGLPLTEIMSAKVDIEFPLKKVKLNFGIKSSHSKNDLNNLYERKNGNDYEEDTSKSNQFTYGEDIQAVYITLNKSFKKLELSIGLRAEHTRGVGISVTALQTNIVDYTKFFPSSAVQYKLNENHIFSLNFARRIGRPSYNFLNPFRFYYTSNNFEQGNPNLQPAFNYITELGYTYKSNLNVKLQYNYVSNYWDSKVYFVDTLHQTNTLTRKNISDKQYVHLNISGSLEPTKWWELESNINGGFSKFIPFDKSVKSDYTGIYWWGELTNNFYLNKKKTFTTEVSGYYYSPRQRDYVNWDAMSSVNIGLRYSMLNKNLLFSFYAEDIFAKSYRVQTNKLNNTVEYSYNGHSVRISISYKFGNKDIKSKQAKNLEEIQRANTNN